MTRASLLGVLAVLPDGLGENLVEENLVQEVKEALAVAIVVAQKRVQLFEAMMAIDVVVVVAVEVLSSSVFSVHLLAFVWSSSSTDV